VEFWFLVLVFLSPFNSIFPQRKKTLWMVLFIFPFVQFFSPNQTLRGRLARPLFSPFSLIPSQFLGDTFSPFDKALGFSTPPHLGLRLPGSELPLLLRKFLPASVPFCFLCLLPPPNGCFFEPLTAPLSFQVD